MKKLIRKKQDSKNNQKEQKQQLNNALSFIPYEYISEDGVCKINESLYSLCITFGDINYHTLDEREQFNIFNRYSVALNIVTSNEGVTLFLQNHIMQQDDIQENILYKDKGLCNPLYVQELNQLIRNSYIKGDNTIETKRYFIITEKAENYEEAYKLLHNKVKDLMQQLSSLNVSVRILNGVERLNLIKNTYNSEENDVIQNLKDNPKEDKVAICPTFFDISNKNYLKHGTANGERYFSTFYLKGYASDIRDTMITQLMEIKGNISLNITFKAYERVEAQSYINKKIVFMEEQKENYLNKQRYKNGYADENSLNTSLRNTLEEANALREDFIQNNQNLFKLQLLIGISASTLDELKEIEHSIITVGKAYSCIIENLQYLEKEAFKSVIPVGKTYINVFRDVITDNVASLIPFKAKELNDKEKALYYGINASTNNLIRVNRRKLKTASGFILATPGSGKSIFAKKEIISILSQYDKDEVFIIDPEREYTNLCNEFNGNLIRMDSNSDVILNPLEMSKEDKLEDKTSLIYNFITNITADTKLSAKHISLIKRSINMLYKNYEEKQLSNKGIKIPAPTLKDFYDVLISNPEEEARELGLTIEGFLVGKNRYSGQTNVDLNNTRLTVFDIRDTSSAEKPISIMVIFETILAKVITNFENGKATWIYIDEAHLMLHSQYATDMLDSFFKRFRKYGAVITLISQNVISFIENKTTQSFLNNSEWVVLLKQAEVDKEVLQGLFNISDSQTQFITNNTEGTGLIYSGGDIIAFRDIIDTNTNLFKLITTKVEF